MLIAIGRSSALLTLAIMCSATPTIAQTPGPDVIVSRIGGSGSDYNEFGPVSGIYAYAMGTTSCNIGDEVLDWFSGGNPNHPVIAQQAYRLLDDRFEQIGFAWLKHGFCAVNEFSCGNCQTTDCSTLGLACADTYSAGLNDSGLGPRSPINAATGAHPHPFSGPSGNSIIAGRLQIDASDVGNAGARYFFEGQYVAHDDSQAGNHLNNASYREVSFNSPTSVVSAADIVMMLPAINAWKDINPNVNISKVLNNDEGGVGVHGKYNLGFLVTDNGNGTWHYEYALHNQTSNRNAGSFSVPMPAGATVTNIEWKGEPHHSGEPYSTGAWSSSRDAVSLKFETIDFSINSNANALRWGQLFNFRFDADVPPVAGVATVGLHEPGAPADLAASAQVPSSAPEPGTAVCFGDGSGTACPCGNTGASGSGCAHSGGGGATISGTGTGSISADDLVLTASNLPLHNTGIFYVGDVNPNAPLFDGIQCTGGSTRRFSGQLQENGTSSDSGFVAQAGPGYFVPGLTCNFQFWTRDVDQPSPCGTGANFSPGYAVTMTN